MDSDQRRLIVFICYARADVNVVCKLYEQLVCDGLDVWLDKAKLVPGQNWENEITRSVKESDIVIVCHSKQFNQKGFRQKEVQIALEQATQLPENAIYIIPARLEECEILEKLARWHWVNLFEEGGYEKLLGALRLQIDKINAKSQEKKIQSIRSTLPLPQKIVLEKKSSENIMPEIGADLRMGMQLESNKISIPELINLVSNVVKLWDDFDVAAKELIVDQLVQLLQKASFSDISLSNSQLSKIILETPARGRILQFEEFRPIFPKLYPPQEERLVLKRYEANWSNLKKGQDSQQAFNWLKQHRLTANPFGNIDFKDFPFYPNGFARPDRWDAFLDPVPLSAYCPSSEDASALAYLLQKECIPSDKEEMFWGVYRGIFPVKTSKQETIPSQSPLFTLAQSAANAWLAVLPLNPDALLELPSVSQNALLELLHYLVGSKKDIINLLQRAGLKQDVIAIALIRKIDEFQNEYSAENTPQDTVLLSWLKIKPPGLYQTYLIFLVDDLFPSTPKWWFDQFSSLISTLFLNGIVIKALASTPPPTLLSLQDIKLSWSDIRLKQSMDGQFDAVTDQEEKSIGKAIRFHELFGPGTTEEETTQKLISASNHSLARLLTLGNRLLQEHCNKTVIEKYLSIDELEDILKTA